MIYPEEAEPEVLERPATIVAYVCDVIAVSADRSFLYQVAHNGLYHQAAAVIGPFDPVLKTSCDFKALQMKCGSAILVHGGLRLCCWCGNYNLTRFVAISISIVVLSQIPTFSGKNLFSAL